MMTPSQRKQKPATMTKTERVAELRKLAETLPGNTSEKCRQIAALLGKKENTIRIAMMDYSPRPMSEAGLKHLRRELQILSDSKSKELAKTDEVDALEF